MQVKRLLKELIVSGKTFEFKTNSSKMNHRKRMKSGGENFDIDFKMRAQQCLFAHPDKL